MRFVGHWYLYTIRVEHIWLWHEGSIWFPHNCITAEIHIANVEILRPSLGDIVINSCWDVLVPTCLMFVVRWGADYRSRSLESAKLICMLIFTCCLMHKSLFATLLNGSISILWTFRLHLNWRHIFVIEVRTCIISTGCVYFGLWEVNFVWQRLFLLDLVNLPRR